MDQVVMSSLSLSLCFFWIGTSCLTLALIIAWCWQSPPACVRGGCCFRSVCKLSRAFSHLRPAYVSLEPSWSLDRVLFLFSPYFFFSPLVRESFWKALFLFALVFGGQVGELSCSSLTPGVLFVWGPGGCFISLQPSPFL